MSLQAGCTVRRRTVHALGLRTRDTEQVQRRAPRPAPEGGLPRKDSRLPLVNYGSLTNVESRNTRMNSRSTEECLHGWGLKRTGAVRRKEEPHFFNPPLPHSALPCQPPTDLFTSRD